MFHFLSDRLLMCLVSNPVIRCEYLKHKTDKNGHKSKKTVRKLFPQDLSHPKLKLMY